MTVVYLILAGALGTLARFFTGVWFERWLGRDYPFGTTVVNLVGSFLFGLGFAWFESRTTLTAPLKVAALTGFLGAFTTFSTLMFETASLFDTGRTFTALLHLVVHGVLGLGCVFFGLWLGRAL